MIEVDQDMLTYSSRNILYIVAFFCFFAPMNVFAVHPESTLLTSKNLNKAQKEAEIVHEKAMHYLTGENIKRDPIEAVKLFRLAAERGKKESQEQLALALLSGNGVGQDSIEAATWAKKAARQGLVSAQYLLATLYYEGNGLRQDLKKAFQWFSKSAHQGQVNSMLRMADMLIYGDGVEKDIYEGLFIYHRAALSGDHWAGERLAFLEAQEQCLLKSKTLILGRYIQCSDRKDIHFQLMNAGAKLLTSDRHSHYIYDSSNLQNGSERIELETTTDNMVASIKYLFDTAVQSDDELKYQDGDELQRLKHSLEKKYGKCHVKENITNPKTIGYEWSMDDNVTVILQRKSFESGIELEYLIPARLENHENIVVGYH